MLSGAEHRGEVSSRSITRFILIRSRVIESAASRLNERHPDDRRKGNKQNADDYEGCSPRC